MIGLIINVSLVTTINISYTTELSRRDTRLNATMIPIFTCVTTLTRKKYNKLIIIENKNKLNALLVTRHHCCYYDYLSYS